MEQHAGRDGPYPAGKTGQNAYAMTITLLKNSEGNKMEQDRKRRGMVGP